MNKQIFFVLTTTAVLLLPHIAHAQTYEPSNRIPVADNSKIGTTVSGTNNQFTIGGGLQRGQNLFHSFTEFSIPKDTSALFDRPTGNQSIITRVTGSFFSDINGGIDTRGSNFLLINPNGVVFGPGVWLNVGKAFMTSTANGTDFIDAQGKTYNFGVNKAGDEALLKIDPNVAFNPAKLIMGTSNPGSKGIEHYGSLSSNNPSQYIGSIGGDVTFYGGQIYNQGGKVDVGGLRQSGSIEFSLQNGVKFPKDVERSNVTLLSRQKINSEIYVRSGGGGSVNIFAKDITLNGSYTGIQAGTDKNLGSPTSVAGDIKLDATGNLILSDGAVIFNQVLSGAVGKGGTIDIAVAGNLAGTNNARIGTFAEGKKGDAGNINIKVAGDILFDGGMGDFRSGVLSTVASGAVGNAGAIDITTRNLSIKNGAQLFASTYGTGNAGKIKIKATDNISIDGGAGDKRSGALSRVEETGVGNAGEIEIETRNLSATNGSGIGTSTYGTGNGGNIKITATGKISLDGAIPLGDGQNAYSSGVSSTVQARAVGKGGEIEIVTPNLSVTNGATLAVSTYGTGDGGKIKITAANGNVSFDGGINQFRSSAFSRSYQQATGNAGGIEIVTGNLAVTNGAGLIANTEGTGNAGNIKINATGKVAFDGTANGLFSSVAESTVEQGAKGNGGGIDISAGTLSIANGAELNSSTEGTRSAGDIFLKSDTITLNKGKILSESTITTGGDIKIVTTGYLLLRNDSLIATDSDSTGKKSSGGNITISSPLIVALPGNNDITANAYQGTGGKVDITSQGLFGIQSRPQGSPFTNDITASSEGGKSGTVQINTPDLDPAKDKGKLPAAPNDASNQISQACSASQRDHKFYITGRGGLPPTANEPQESEALWSDAREIKTQPATTVSLPPKYAPPAIGLVLEPNGRARLIAAHAPVIPSQLIHPASCPPSRD
ncbi:filamentous hemagglutinin N-terminal domain-containing protein [Chamaesiphon sp. VAR_48_metabat_135_sub]|uniref:two-partner secretion domain-containing protein n=1 Tax=Chamaesiphon sp. VAR_48_metabat_135_sub TaxID=2964699 RepID=UPI00286C3F6B|nr:filamentous hemagglutinin N-terminal domain-containing protein [Chamaesiphon sp. VAR_48_metabat_135_sub]